MARLLITPAMLRAYLERLVAQRYYPGRADAIIDATITERGLEGSGYDPTWIEQRRAARAREGR